MSIYNQIFSIIVPAANANFSAHTYSQIYASAAATPTVNGQAISMAAGSILNISIRSISGGTNCFLLGDNLNLSSDATVFL